MSFTCFLKARRKVEKLVWALINQGQQEERAGKYLEDI